MMNQITTIIGILTIILGLLLILKAKARYPRVRELFALISINPALIYIVIFLFSLIIVISLTFAYYGYNKELLRDILVESHGLLFDLLIIGIVIIYWTKKGETYLENKRSLEEIYDNSYTNSEVAKQIIVKNIKRLNRNGITKMTLDNCYLSNSALPEVKLQGAYIYQTDLKNSYLFGANFEKAFLGGVNFDNSNLTGNVNFKGADIAGVSFIEADLFAANMEKANLTSVNFNGTNLEGVNFSRATLMYVNLKNAKNLSLEQIAKSTSFYKVEFDSSLEEQLKKNYQNLFKDDEIDKVLSEGTAKMATSGFMYEE